MTTNITQGDVLQICGVAYRAKIISSCNDCCLSNTRACAMLDPAITCGEKSHIGFETIGFNPNPVSNNKNIEKQE